MFDLLKTACIQCQAKMEKHTCMIQFREKTAFDE